MADEKRVLLVQGGPGASNATAALRAAGYAAGAVATGKEGLIEAWRSRPDLIIVDLALSDLPGLELIRRLRADARTAQTPLLLFTTQTDMKDLLEAKRAGVSEVVAARPGAEAELVQKVQALLPHAGAVAGASVGAGAAASAAEPPGKLIAVMSAKGGVGTSSIAVNLAHSLAAQAAGKRVAVVDLVLPLGSLSQIAGATSAGTIVDATKLPAAQLTPELVARMAVSVPTWQFFLVSGPADPAAAQELQLDRLETFFTSLRHAYDYVMVDLGRALSRVSLPIIYHASAIVLVISPDISTVALTKTTLKYLESQGVMRHRMFPVLNRAVGLEGMNRAELETELGLKVVGLIPHFDISFTLANNQHQPLINHVRNESTRFVFRDLASELLAKVEGAPR
jgi:pilus assembly protein CpaE